MIAIMACGEPDEEAKTFIPDSLYNDGISRFLYSWLDDCDLNRLAKIPTDTLTADEKEIWRRGKRLLTLQAGDYILHKNLPVRGTITAARICGKYFFDANPKPLNADGRRDGRHCFHVDKVFEFRRDAVHPQMQTKLKVMGAIYRISDVKEFFESMRDLVMPFDEADCKAAAEVGVILTDSNNTAADRSIKPLTQRAGVVDSPLKKISAIRENYLNDLLKVLHTVPPVDPSRKELLDNIREAFRMFSPDALKKFLKNLFVGNGYVLIDDASDLVFEPFSEREPMHDFYKFVAEPKKIFVRLKTDDTACDDFTNDDGNIRILIDLTNSSDAPIQGSGVILIDAENFANILARHGTR